MLTQRQLVNTIQVQLLTSKGPLPTIGQSNNFCPCHRIYPHRKIVQNGPGTGSWVPRWFEFAVTWGIGLERAIQISPVFYQTHLKLIPPGLHTRERHHYINFAVCCVSCAPVFVTYHGDWRVNWQYATVGRDPNHWQSCCHCLYFAYWS